MLHLRFQKAQIRPWGKRNLLTLIFQCSSRVTFEVPRIIGVFT